MVDAGLGSKTEVAEVRWFSFHRVRRIIRDFTIFVVSLYYGLLWFRNADWQHPVRFQKEQMNRLFHFVKDSVSPTYYSVKDSIGHLFTGPADLFFSITFVVISTLLVVAIIASFGDLWWSITSPRGSHRYRKPF